MHQETRERDGRQGRRKRRNMTIKAVYVKVCLQVKADFKPNYTNNESPPSLRLSPPRTATSVCLWVTLGLSSAIPLGLNSSPKGVSLTWDLWENDRFWYICVIQVRVNDNHKTSDSSLLAGVVFFWSCSVFDVNTWTLGRAARSSSHLTCTTVFIN